MQTAFPSPSSSQKVVHDIAVHVGQPKVAAGVVERQPFVIESQQVQNRGVPVVNVHRVFYRLISEVVGRTVDVSAPAHAVDIVGTGGDRSGSFNISTATALVCPSGRAADPPDPGPTTSRTAIRTPMQQA